MPLINTLSVKKALDTYKKQVTDELDAILNYWISNTIDQKQGGFYGSVSNENKADLFAQKGIVLNSRILWAFSAASRYSQNTTCIDIAERAFNYIDSHFIDYTNGGVYWSVDHHGNMLDSKKQIYGLAFCLYSLAEYYKVTKNETVLQLAKKLFKDIEKYSYDKINDGYTEAFARNWNSINDLRLSEKDINEKKTLNTHLHIIEAYVNFYRISPEQFLLEKINGLLKIFEKYFINKQNCHLNLFMTEDWKIKSSIQSFGHDIEASWLLYESAEIAGNDIYIHRYKEIALQLADAAAEAIDNDGGLWYEYDPSAGQWIKEKHSWPQAEAMVGFFNAYQLSGDEKYLQLSLNSWTFIKKHIKDNKNGEWFWGVEEDYTIMQKEKAGFWKCPYHNVRACLEISKRISSIQQPLL